MIRLQRLWTFVGYVVAAASGLLVAVGLVDLLSGQDHTTPAGLVVGLIVVFAAAGTGGIALAVRSSKRRRMLAESDAETTVLRVIKAKGGRATLPEIALACSMSIDDARRTVEGMCAKGYGTVEVTDSGTLLYVFEGFAPSG